MAPKSFGQLHLHKDELTEEEGKPLCTLRVVTQKLSSLMSVTHLSLVSRKGKRNSPVQGRTVDLLMILLFLVNLSWVLLEPYPFFSFSKCRIGVTSGRFCTVRPFNLSIRLFRRGRRTKLLFEEVGVVTT